MSKRLLLGILPPELTQEAVDMAAEFLQPVSDQSDKLLPTPAELSYTWENGDVSYMVDRTGAAAPIDLLAAHKLKYDGDLLARHTSYQLIVGAGVFAVSRAIAEPGHALYEGEDQDDLISTVQQAQLEVDLGLMMPAPADIRNFMGIIRQGRDHYQAGPTPNP